MVDSGVQGSEVVEANETQIKQKKTKMCAACGVTKTPLWRSSPAGPKTLCNACGIRSKKKDPSSTKENNDRKKKRKRRNKEISLKQRIRNLVSQVMPHRSRVERRWRKLGEVERAAVLLMSFSA